MKKTRNLGAAHHGVSHWWLQRVTALALIPLSIWFFSSMLVVAEAPDPFRVADWLSSPVNALLMLLLLVAGFWHAKLGMQVIIEDYFHTPTLKFSLLLLNNLCCWVLAVGSALAVLRLHMFSLVSGF